SKLQRLVPTIGTFHTSLPLTIAFLLYDEKYSVTSRRHVTLSFNEIRQILNLSQIKPPISSFTGPKIITFDGDQTLYSDGANFTSNPKLAHSIYLLLKNRTTVAVVTAAGYEYAVEKYSFRLTGLIDYFREKGLNKEECGRFYMFGGECNYLMRLTTPQPVAEEGPGGWITSTKHIPSSPGNWSQASISSLLDVAYESFTESLSDMKITGRVIRKKRAVGLIPQSGKTIPREVLDECVLRVQSALYEKSVSYNSLPYCAFNGGTDAWVDCGNKRVGVSILQSYLGFSAEECLHVGDQFLNTGNDYAARGCSPCAWITGPDETGYIL
ncbi:hypothetical protein TL16_g09675, partial [Triparma laevis f. inornata]